MKKSVIVLLHLVLWAFVFLTFFNIINALQGFPKPAGYNPYSDYELYIRTSVTVFILCIPFYFGYFVTPPLFKKNRRKPFIWLTIAFGIFFPIAMSILDDGFQKSAIMQSVFLFAFLNTFLILGIGFRSLFGWIVQKNVQQKLEKQNLESELALLRMQINPHFLFNTLHNIDTLIKDNQLKASQALIKLSEMMRYMLYKTKKEQVTLAEEIAYIENYIALEKLRLKNPEFLLYNISGNYRSNKIAPMLFIPFIENAFKHSVDSNTKHGVKITIDINSNGITCNCENKMDKTDSTKDQTHGIGIEIVKKRLGVLYPRKHELIINEYNNVFKVKLSINWNDN